MDQVHPAYWLSRDPAEAADFLARTAIASRVVGGFVKKAKGEFLTPEMKDILTNSAIGAGIGGAGGLGVGLFSKKKKNPLSTALTGAALGGVLGGALPEVYKGVKSYTDEPPPALMTPQMRQSVASYNAMHPLWKLWYKWTGEPVPIDPKVKVPAPAAAGVHEPTLEEVQAKDTAPGLAKQTFNKTISDTAGGVSDFAKDNTGRLGVHAGILGLQGAYYKGIHEPTVARNEFLEGSTLLKPRAGTILHTPVEGTPGRGGNFAATRTLTGQTAPAAVGSLRSEMLGSKSMFGNMWNNAQQGRNLMDIQAGRPNLWGDPTLPGGGRALPGQNAYRGMRPETVEEVRGLGRTSLKTKGKGAWRTGGRMAGGAGALLIPQSIPLLYDWWKGE